MAEKLDRTSDMFVGLVAHQKENPVPHIFVIFQNKRKVVLAGVDQLVG